MHNEPNVLIFEELFRSRYLIRLILYCESTKFETFKDMTLADFQKLVISYLI